MSWLRRRKRVDLGLGRYVAPAPVDPAPAERVAAEGVAIAEAVVRLGMRNRIIVDSLRDRRGFDTTALLTWAAAEFEALALRELEAAERIRQRSDWPTVGDPLVEDADEVDDERRELRWREAARRATAEAFRALAADERRLIDLVEQARIEAWHDVAGVIMERVDAASHREDADYAAERSNRMAELVALDLSALAIERGHPLS
jgi:hypothetical protein